MLSQLNVMCNIINCSNENCDVIVKKLKHYRIEWKKMSKRPKNEIYIFYCE
jgi:hypothetical protein